MQRILSTARWVVLLAILIAIVSTFSVRPAFAGGVVGNGDPASCTFSAFDTALSGGGNVTFNCGAAPHTIVVNVVRDIGTDTTIDGGNLITLSAVAFHFQVINDKKLTLKNIKLANGNHSITGGIENYGIVKAVNVTFHKNTSTSDGGAIVNYGKLIVNQSLFTKNRAALSGGAIANFFNGDVKIKNSTFKNNRATGGAGRGGAVANHKGDLILIGSTLLKNRAFLGGAVWTDSNTTNTFKKSTLNANKGDIGAGLANWGDIEIDSSILSNNISAEVGGGIYNVGFMTIAQSTLQGNQARFGGGISNDTGTLFITQSTLSGNSAGIRGGGVYSSGDAIVENSTLSGNSAASADGVGGWFQFTQTATFQFVTIANNSGALGGGILAFSSGQFIGKINLRNTVLSKNTGSNCSGTNLVSNGYNLSTDTSCGILTQTGDQSNKRARLGALANNGGPTETHLPLAGSKLINKGGGNHSLTVDQRNFPRPIGGISDIGSVEVE